MRTTSRRVSNAELAGYEGALPPYYFVNPGSAHHTVQIQRHLALRELMKLASRIPARTEDWARVGKVLHLDKLWLSKDARQLVDLLCAVSADIAQGENGRKLHPRLNVLFTHARQMLNLRQTSAALLMQMEVDPWGTTEVLGRMLPSIHRILRGRSHLVRELKHEAEQSEKLSRLRASFGALAKRYPTAIVLRLEVFRVPDPADRVAGMRATHELVRLAELWKRHVDEMLEGKLVGFESCLQLGSGGELGAHAMLVIDGQRPETFFDLEDAVGALWRKVAGERAPVISCKSPMIGVYCRGRRLGAPGDSLSAELSDAALYFAKGGGHVWPVLIKAR